MLLVPSILALSPARGHAQRVVGTAHSAAGEPLSDVIVTTNSTFTGTRTDRLGVFRVQLPPGAHVLTFRRIGFEPAQTTVKVDGRRETDTLRIVLSPATHELQGLVVRGERDDAMSLTLSAQTLRNAPALGESDVFRSLPLLPAVSQPNDVINVLHLAGGANDEAGISLDGHPLQAPFHVGNVFGALNVAALEQANVVMHHLPARYDGYLSGKIELFPRAVRTQATREVVVSLLSASATVTQPIGSRHGILASGRTTYIDQVLKAASSANAGDGLEFPRFRDVLVQVTGGRGEAWAWGVLGYAIRTAAEPSRLEPLRVPLQMTEALIGVRSSYAKASWNIETRISVNRNRVRNSEFASGIGSARAFRDNLIDQQWVSGELDVSLTGDSWQLHNSIASRARTHRFLWSPGFVSLAINTPVPAPVDTVMSQIRHGASSELSLALNATTSVSGGAHLSLVNGGVFPSPRVAVEWRPSDGVIVAAALDRRFQFDAVVGAPLEVSMPQPVFFLDRPRRADVGSISMMWNVRDFWRFDQARLGSTMYHKRYQDRTLLASPGSTPNDSLPASLNFDRGPGDVSGISLSAELSTARRLTLYGTYTGQQVREVYRGEERPSAWDVPHQISVYTSLLVTKRLAFNTVLQAHSGPATTPVLNRVFVPLDHVYGQRYTYGSPNSSRFPGYRRLDASLSYGWRVRQSEWKLTAQAINLFNRTNGMSYHMPTYLACSAQPTGCVDDGANRRSLPVIPSVGLEVRW